MTLIGAKSPWTKTVSSRRRLRTDSAISRASPAGESRGGRSTSRIGASRVAADRSISSSCRRASPWRPPAFEPVRPVSSQAAPTAPSTWLVISQGVSSISMIRGSGTGIPALGGNGHVRRQASGVGPRPRGEPSRDQVAAVGKAQSPRGIRVAPRHSRDLVDGRAEALGDRDELGILRRGALRRRWFRVRSPSARVDATRSPSVTTARPSPKSTSRVRTAFACCHRSRTACPSMASTRRSPSKAGCVFRRRTRSMTRLTTDRSSATSISSEV